MTWVGQVQFFVLRHFTTSDRPKPEIRPIPKEAAYLIVLRYFILITKREKVVFSFLPLQTLFCLIVKF